MKDLVVLAADTGKSSCRLVSGHYDGKKIKLGMDGRFDLYQTYLPDGWLYLDIVNVFSQLKLQLQKYAVENGSNAVSLGIDTWGSDFGLLDKNNTLLSLPIFYKEQKLAQYFPEFLDSVDMKKIYFKTGMDVAPYNSPVRLFIKNKLHHTDLSNAYRFLGIADLMSFFFSGNPVSELTSISVTRMVDLATNQYSKWLLDDLGIDNSILRNEIVMPGTIIGDIMPQVGSEIGMPNLKIVAVPGHDTTASALAIPEMDNDSIFFGSGTTMVYCSINRNLQVTDEMYNFNTSIVKGFDNTDILVRNFSAGMWIMHALKREWPGGISYEEMYAMAEKAKPFKMVFDIDSSFFEVWGDIKGRIAQYCELTGQTLVDEDAQYVRCIVESYALKARWALDQYEKVLGRPVKKLIVVGGGVYSSFLCQMLADATRRVVVTGAAEATSLGNILTQLYALGEIANENEMREIVSNSCPTNYYEPKASCEMWDEAYHNYLDTIAKFKDIH